MKVSQCVLTLLIQCVLCVAFASSVPLTWKTDLMGACSQEDSNKIDLAFGEVLLFGELRIPMVDDLESAQKWCNESKTSLKVIKETSKQCLTGLGKQILNMVNFGVIKGIKKNCKNDTTMALAGANLGCLNKVQDKMVDAMANVTKAFRMINLLPGDAKLAALCCSFHTFIGQLEAAGSSECGKNSVDHMIDLINDFSGEALDLVCRSISKDSDTCKQFAFPEDLEAKIDPTLKQITFVPACVSALTLL